MSKRISVADLPPRYQAQAMAQIQRQQKARKLRQESQSRNKYGAEKAEVNGIRFDSKKEARRFSELSFLEHMGYIRDLRLQQDYTLQEAYTTTEGERIRAIRYRADFVYELTDKDPQIACVADREYFRKAGPGAKIIEDAKGCRTDIYTMKRKMMADRGYSVREV